MRGSAVEADFLLLRSESLSNPMAQASNHTSATIVTRPMIVTMWHLTADYYGSRIGLSLSRYGLPVAE